MKKRAWRLLFWILVIFIVSQPKAGFTEEIKVIRFGLIPSEEAHKLLTDSKPFIDVFEAKIGIPIKPFVAMDYAAVVEALRTNQLEVAFLGPASYVLAKDKVKCPIEAVARGVMEITGKSSYRSFIITQQNSSIISLQDLKGKSFGFVDLSSTSGNFVPRYVFGENGIDPERDFTAVYFTGTHQASLIAVKEKKIDAAAVAEEVYTLAIKKGHMKQSDFRVIFKSDPIPGSPFVIRTNLPTELQVKLRSALLEIKNVRFGKLGVIVSMDPAKDEDYNIVRELVPLKRRLKQKNK